MQALFVRSYQLRSPLPSLSCKLFSSVGNEWFAFFFLKKKSSLNGILGWTFCSLTPVDSRRDSRIFKLRTPGQERKFTVLFKVQRGRAASSPRCHTLPVRSCCSPPWCCQVTNSRHLCLQGAELLPWPAPADVRRGLDGRWQRCAGGCCCGWPRASRGSQGSAGCSFWHCTRAAAPGPSSAPIGTARHRGAFLPRAVPGCRSGSL